MPSLAGVVGVADVLDVVSLAGGAALISTQTRYSESRPPHPHANPLFRTWAPPPTCGSGGLRAGQRANGWNSGFPYLNRPSSATASTATSDSPPGPQRPANGHPRPYTGVMHDPTLSTMEHRDLIEALALSRLLPHDTLSAEECLGRRLATDLHSLIPLPPFTNSAMDGFALRREDLAGEGPWSLPVVADIPAGDTREHRLEAGQAMRIMTGAPLPQGADTVVKVEHTDHAAGVAQAPASVEIRVAPKLGANVRVKGEALEAGSPVLEAGCLLDGTALAAAISVGHGTLAVLPRPRVLVVTTGTELRRAGEALERGQIPDSNGILLRGLVEDAGGRVVANLRTGDTPEELRRALDEAPDADLVITAGGISAGAYEVVRLTLGTDAGFHHVAQQPGGPQGVGATPVGTRGRETPVICLPGNPVSVFTTFHMYVAGALAVMSGLVRPERGATVPSAVVARARVGWESPEGKTQFIPVRFVDEAGTCSGDEAGVRWVEPVHPLGSKSHLVASLAHAQGIGVVAPEFGEVVAGQELAVVALVG